MLQCNGLMQFNGLLQCWVLRAQVYCSSVLLRENANRQCRREKGGSPTFLTSCVCAPPLR